MTIQNSELNQEAHWMPFSAMQDFRKEPRLLISAQDHHYHSQDGRKIYDSFSGLWTCGVGHCHPKIVEAVQKQVAEMDYAIGFQVSHPKAFELADQILDLAGDKYGSVFFTNSGSESADTALKVALAYHRANGEAQRTRLIGRARGYHGTNFGGMSVGGIMPNRKTFSANLIPGVDHLPHTLDLSKNAMSRGQPEYGAHLADELEHMCAIHGGETIAAVIVEPAAGSTGVLPPPKGYLSRLREICDRHGILLIFDEVITAFGRVGHSFAAKRLGVVPDIITTAKGLTNGMIPMGGVIISKNIHEMIIENATSSIEFFHGYTYSGHPVACAAGLATLQVYRDEGSFEQAHELESLFEDCLHAFSDHKRVIDVRNFGLMGAIELEPREGAPGERGFDVHKECFWNEDLIVRNGADILQFSPFLNSKPADMMETFEKVWRAIDAVE